MEVSVGVRAAGVVLMAVAAISGCAGASVTAGRPAPAASSATSAAPSTTPTAPKPPAATAPASPPPFRWHVTNVTAAQIGRSWRPGCPVAPSQLRAVSLTYWGFDHQAHNGTLVVNAQVVAPIVEAFRRIYTERFPIRRMMPIAVYGGDDNVSMAADNTSAFNCRYAVASGAKHWSMHAYGEAVDIDPLENPYILNGRVYPPTGAPYVERVWVRPGMVVFGSVPVRALTAVGWGWGGNWPASPDYQHFSSNGR